MSIAHNAPTARLRIAGLYIVTEVGPGQWTAAHREQAVAFSVVRMNAAGMVQVASAAGGTYIVDHRRADCTCPDNSRNREFRPCKHRAAVQAVADHCAGRRAERQAEIDRAERLREACAAAGVAIAPLRFSTDPEPTREAALRAGAGC